jgi:hypothetical protein
MILNFKFKEETAYEIKGAKAVLDIEIQNQKVSDKDYDSIMENWKNIEETVLKYGTEEKQE